jgi:two-component system NtrC family sensor kinase
MSARRPVVLCVDDETPILHSLRRVFLDEPWESLFATSGEEGLHLMVSRDIDLVLADFRMPGMDGVEFLKQVKAIRPECMRVVLSGYADITLIVEALNEGQIYKFLSKPWNDDELRHHVRNLLDHQHLDRENHRLNAELVDINRRLAQKVDASSQTAERLERTVEFARVAIESLPVVFVGIDGRGEILVANAEARRLLRAGATEPLDRAMAAALLGARRSPTGFHAEPFSADGAVGTVVATAGVEPLELARRKEQEAPGPAAPAAEAKS